MKKCILAINFLILSVIGFAQNEVTIYGQISNPKSDKVSVWMYSDLLSYKGVAVDSAIIDKDGKFSVTFLWRKNYRTNLRAGEDAIELYLSSGDRLEIKADATKFNESIKYSGTGSIVNIYLAKKEARNNWRAVSQENANKSAELAEEKYTRYADSVYADRKDFFNKYFSEIPDKTQEIINFMEYESGNIMYSWAANKLRYPGFYNYYNKQKNKIKVSDTYYDFLWKMDLNNSKSLYLPAYHSVLESYIYLSLKKATEADTSLKGELLIKAELALIEKVFSGEVRDFLFAKKAYTLIVQQNDLKNGKSMLDKYAATAKNREYLEMLNNAYLLTKRLASGNPAPEFKFSDINGKMVSLNDFKGKVVYLDIWASWCGPCVKEIPAAKKLEEQFKGMDVAFLCVSIDQDESAWKKIIMEKEMTGTHLISKNGFDSEIARMYNIRGIPRYILIDKEGMIVNLNANRPSDGAKEDIEKLLN